MRKDADVSAVSGGGRLDTGVATEKEENDDEVGIELRLGSRLDEVRITDSRNGLRPPDMSNGFSSSGERRCNSFSWDWFLSLLASLLLSWDGGLSPTSG